MFKKTIKISGILISLFLVIALIAFEKDISAIGESVKIVETGQTYTSLAAAVSDANTMGSATIEISDDLKESDYVEIQSDITIIGVDGHHTVTNSYMLDVSKGGKLTLGNGDNTNLLTIKYDYQVVRIINGELILNDGVKIQNSKQSYGLQLTGTKAKATLNGGIIEANIAIVAEMGAVIKAINGGTFSGKEFSAHISDQGTRIDEINGGSFIKTGTGVSNGFNLQNEATIGIIRAGYFEAASYAPLAILRGAWIDEISGGTFVSKNLPVNGAIGLHIVADVYGTYPKKTGIGKLTGTTTARGYYSIRIEGENARIDEIAGGDYRGEFGMLVMSRGTVEKISGGSFSGETAGIYNLALIGEITGANLQITSPTKYAIYNAGAGVIDKINNGLIVNPTGGYGIVNYGLINQINDGVIIGGNNAIYNGKPNATDVGKLGLISSGVFWGKTGAAIVLYSSVEVEPGLTAYRGSGRYWGNNGVVFNKEELAIYPADYWLSEETMVVDNLADVSFKYLTKGEEPQPEIYTVEVVGSYATLSGAGEYQAGETVTIAAGSRSGYNFIGWTSNDAIALSAADSATTTFVMPEYNVVVTANWQVIEEKEEPKAVKYKVNITGSYAGDNGAGEYEAGVSVTIKAGERSGYKFAVWISKDANLLDAASEAVTTFTMPEHDVSFSATWKYLSYNQPRTGDSWNTVLWGLLLAASTIIVVVTGKRKKDEKVD